MTLLAQMKALKSVDQSDEQLGEKRVDQLVVMLAEKTVEM